MKYPNMQVSLNYCLMEHKTHSSSKIGLLGISQFSFESSEMRQTVNRSMIELTELNSS